VYRVERRALHAQRPQRRVDPHTAALPSDDLPPQPKCHLHLRTSKQSHSELPASFGADPHILQ